MNFHPHIIQNVIQISKKNGQQKIYKISMKDHELNILATLCILQKVHSNPLHHCKSEISMQDHESSIFTTFHIPQKAIHISENVSL